MAACSTTCAPIATGTACGRHEPRRRRELVAVRDDSALIEPVCQASLLRYFWPGPGSRSRIFFSNPASEKRQNLTVRVSYDEGDTWPVSKTVHPSPAAYSCLAVLPGGHVGCLFECGAESPYERIVLARIPLP